MVTLFITSSFYTVRCYPYCIYLMSMVLIFIPTPVHWNILCCSKAFWCYFTSRARAEQKHRSAGLSNLQFSVFINNSQLYIWTTIWHSCTLSPTAPQTVLSYWPDMYHLCRLLILYKCKYLEDYVTYFELY